MFSKRRMSLRHVALPLLAIGAVYFGLSVLNTEKTTVVQTVTVASIPAAPVVSPNAIARDSGLSRDAGSQNLKAAFDMVPTTATYNYASERAEAQKPVVAVTAVQEPVKTAVLADKIASIQTGISNILQAGTDMLSKKTVAVGKGDTLMELLVRNNVPRSEAHEAIAALSKIYDPGDLNPGHEITVFFHQDPSIADPAFSGLSIEKDTINTVIVNRSVDGSYSVDQEEKTVHRGLKAFKGRIDSSLYISAKAQNVPDAVILDLIKMYSWNVDFQRDIQGGDAFEVMYEEYATEDGEIVPGKGEIVYAMLDLSGNQMPYYRFEDSTGDVDYFDQEGKSAKRPLMKTPIDGARLSSGFGMRRHPVLGYSKMHKGVDFAAARGTPIYAAGDGTIEKLGKFSSYGNYIRIRHRGDIKTAYAHLNGYKSGLKSGSRVRHGQVIGYVGTTGRSTGPHLHYEVMVNGAQVNPNSIKLPTGKALAGKDLKAFQSMRAQNVQAFNSKLQKAPAVASLATPATR